jgi:two-component system KDP operon response regulator KdpE
MARGPSLLVIDDDRAIRRLLNRELRTAGYQVCEMEPSAEALARAARDRFDVLILDIDAPTGGAEAIRMIREDSPVPIVALSLRPDEDTAVDALESGADDFIRKPFSTRELLARVRNALRRKSREEGKPTPVVTGDLAIDLLHRRVRSRGKEVHLPAKQYEVLRALTEAADKVVPHKEILCAVWGPRGVDRIIHLRLAIRELRRKLEPDPGRPQYILTETRVGYRLEVQTRATSRHPRPAGAG